jgi:hypothetical protein
MMNRGEEGGYGHLSPFKSRPLGKHGVRNEERDFLSLKPDGEEVYIASCAHLT